MRKGHWSWVVFVMVLSSCALAGCGAAEGGLGATPGGEQDVGLFREVVSRGGVPPPSSMTVSGWLAEHDLPLEAPPCKEVLCLSAGVGVARAADTGRNEVFVQLGLASGIDESTFRRPALNLAAVVDRSGSMEGEKMAAVKVALHRLVEKLGEGDRLALILFDDRVDLLSPSQPVTDRGRLHRLIDTIETRGATDIESALRRGYEVVEAARHASRMDRVILMTDALPNTGKTSTREFQHLVEEYAQKDIGLSAMGVGIDFGQDLALSISRARGGNYFFLRDASRIASVFDRDFDLIVTPIAHDLRLTIKAAGGYRITEVYGLPASSEGRSTTLDVATVFLSRNRGALLVRLSPSGAWGDGRLFSETTLSYRVREQTGLGMPLTREGEVSYEGTEVLGEQTVWFSQRGVTRTVALVNVALAVRQGLMLYERSHISSAIEQVTRAAEELRDQISREKEAGDLVADLNLLEKLQLNMSRRGHEQRTPTEDFYHQPAYSKGLFGCTVSRSPGGPLVSWLVLLLLVLWRARLRALWSHPPLHRARR